VDSVKDGQAEAQPQAVPARATRGGEVRARWAWTEPSVWTERMLTALEEGVKGGRWYSLMDKVYHLPNLGSAFAKVKTNKGAAGVDHQTIEMFERHLEANLGKLAEELRTAKYRPRAVRRVWIDKPGKPGKQRPLGIPCVRDRVVQAALVNVLEPMFEKEFAAQSYGFRPGRSAQDALRRVVKLKREAHTWVVDADLESYFDTIPQRQLLERVKAKVSDGKVLSLIEAFLRQGVMEEAKYWVPQEGTPQGAVLSPLLSNLYLDEIDHRMAAEGFEMVRYADDFVILCRSETEARRARERVAQWTTAAGLKLHPDKTHVVEATKRGGFDFPGYHFERGKRWPRKKSWKKLKDTIRAKTRRNEGRSLKVIIEDVNKTLVGWFGYFKHSYPITFERVDGWTRMRLRSILRQRSHRKGRSNRRDHQRWPNAFFAKQGLYSTTAAYALACQSSRR
jgi:RNA-directed DNA polymerase